MERDLLRFVRMMHVSLVKNHNDPNRACLLCVDKTDLLVSIEIGAAQH